MRTVLVVPLGGVINTSFQTLAMSQKILSHLTMKFLSLEPFVPSGKKFEDSKQLFLELGFKINWDTGDYIGFERDGCKFILQKYDNSTFAENFMITVKINNAEEFWKEVSDKQLVQKFGVRVGKPTVQAYGTEVNLIDIAGVCWHFVE